MKKTLKTIAMLFFVILIAGMFTNCLHIAVDVLEDVAAKAEQKEERKKIRAVEAEIGRKMAVNEYLSKDGRKFETRRSYDSKTEDRLTRRTSTLEGGTVIDISPYLLHSESIAIVNNEIQYYKLILSLGGDGNELHEFDITASYKVNNQEYREDKSGGLLVYNNGYGTAAKSNFKLLLHSYYAYKHGVKHDTFRGISDIKGFNIDYNKTRTKKVRYSILPPTWSDVKSECGFYVYETKPCYYMFDVEVEYLKKKASGKNPAVYEKYNKVYRSDFTSLTAASIDVHSAISEETNDWYPVINFVKVVKYPL